MIDPREPVTLIGWNNRGVQHLRHGDIRCDARNNDRRGNCRAIFQTDTAHPTIRCQDLGHLAAQAHVTAMPDEKLMQMRRQRTDAAAELFHLQRGRIRHRQPEGQCGGTARGFRTAVGHVERQERQHSAQHTVLLLVGEIAVQHIGDRSEKHVVDTRPLEFICRTGVHLIECFRRLPHLKSPQRPRRRLAPRHDPRHAVDCLGSVHLVEMGQQLHRIAVVDERLIANPPECHGHNIEVDGRQRVEPEIATQDGRCRELDGPGDLESVAVEQLHRRGHTAGVQLRVETQGVQPRLLQLRRCGKSVVPRADHDRLEVRHASR